MNFEIRKGEMNKNKGTGLMRCLLSVHVETAAALWNLWKISPAFILIHRGRAAAGYRVLRGVVQRLEDLGHLPSGPEVHPEAGHGTAGGQADHAEEAAEQKQRFHF